MSVVSPLERTRTVRRLSGPGRRRSVSRFGLLALAPFALFLIVFGVYPIVQLIRMSASEVAITQGSFQFRPVGLANFEQILRDPDTGAVIAVTVIFIVVTVSVTVLLGAGLAMLVDRAPMTGRIARRVLIWPTVIAPVVVSVIWLLLLSPTIGAVNKVLLLAGWGQQGWLGDPVGALLSVIFVDIWHWTPLVFLLVYTGLQSVDGEVLEAARVDGASETQVIARVVLPILRPVILAAAGIRLVFSVKAFDEMYLLTHGGPGNATNLISLHVRTVFFDRLQFGYGAAIGVAVIAVFALSAMGIGLVRRSMRSAGSPSAEYR